MGRSMTFALALSASLIFAGSAVAAEMSAGEAAKPQAGGYEGRVVVAGTVTPGARVYAYRSFADFMESKPLAVSAVTGDDGKYSMDMPKGSYYLVAKKRKDMSADAPVAPGDLFSFQGSNPVAVQPGKYVHVGFSLLPYGKDPSYSAYEDPVTGGLTGTVTYEGKPLEGAYVTLYMDTAEDLRGATYASSPPTGKSGVFRFDSLPETEFFVVARKRASGKGAGPLTDGDYFGFFPTNPVRVKAGKLAGIELPVITKAGEIGREDSLFRDTGTMVTGRVTDRAGHAVEGVYVFAYLEKVMAHKRPEFISKTVDREGRYTLNLAAGGTYYLGARSQYGDTPALGEWYGRWEGTGDHSIVLKTGQALKDIDIMVEKILP